jgi:hypothetical protein
MIWNKERFNMPLSATVSWECWQITDQIADPQIAHKQKKSTRLEIELLSTVNKSKIAFPNRQNCPVAGKI